MRRRVDVRIGEIVMQGSGTDDPHGLAGAIEGELSRLAAGRGLPGVRNRELAVERIDTEETSETRGEGTGVRLARAIYGGLRR